MYLGARVLLPEGFDEHPEARYPPAGFPRLPIVEIQHANPYYDDSYAVSSANLGPYGDAIMREPVPCIEKESQEIGRGWARFTYSGAEVRCGDRFERCWNGGPTAPNRTSRLRYNAMYVPAILRRIEQNHPPGADLKSWRY